MHTRSSLSNAAILTVMSMACSADPDVYLMETAYLIDEEGNRAFLGSGCESVSGETNGGTGHGGPGYEITHEQRRNGVLVTVRGAGNQVLAERGYTVAFLATGEEKTVDVDLGDGRTLRLRHWGGDTCEPELLEAADGGI